MPHTIRKRLQLTALVPFIYLSICGVGCNALQGQDTGVPSDLDGYAGILYLNRSRSLTQTILALGYPDEPPIVWVNAIAPDSWESLIVECGFNTVDFVSAIPVSLATGLEGEQVEDGAAPLRIGEDLICGSLLVVEISDGDKSSGQPDLLFDVRTVPATLPPDADQITTSAVTPGAASGLLLVRFERLIGEPTQASISWDNPSGRVFVSRVDLADEGPVAATLIECPVLQFGWGNVTDPTVPGVLFKDAQIELTGPPPLTEGVGFNCGDLMTMRIAGAPIALDNARLELSTTSAGSTVPTGSLDLFGNIRQVLNDEGLAGRMSTNLSLLPAPGATSQNEP